MSGAEWWFERVVETQVRMLAQRLYGESLARHQAPWLLTLRVPMADRNGGFGASSLQCRAVVDDFGTMVPVTGWT